jgi:superfamily II DNA/RNA helicase
MDSFRDKLARINKLREKAMTNPHFLKSAKEHEKAIVAQSPNKAAKVKRKKKKHENLSQIYSEIPEQKTIYH